MSNVPRLYITQPNYYIVKSLEEFECCLDNKVSIDDIMKTLDGEAKEGDDEAKEGEGDGEALKSCDMSPKTLEYLKRAISLVQSTNLEIIRQEVKTIQSYLYVKPGVQCAKSVSQVFIVYTNLIN